MPRLATVDELKAYLNERSVESDDLLAGILGGAEAFAERYCRRRFSPDPPLDSNGDDTGTPVTKILSTRGRSVIRVRDLRSGTLTLGGLLLNSAFDYEFGYAMEGEPATHLFLMPRISTYFARAPSMFGAFVNDLTITGRWGWSPTPDDVKDGVLTIAARKFRERSANWGDTVTFPEGGAISYFRLMPASVKAAFDSYRVANLALV